MNMNENKEEIIKGLIIVFSVFILALCYNLFFLPNNLVVGGVSGLAIVLQESMGINPTLFIYASTGVLLILSYIILGKDKTMNTVVGSILYPVMITATVPIANYLIPYFNFNDIYLIAFMSAILYGLGNGLVFRYEYSTGGTDIVTSIFAKLFKFPEGKSMLLSNILVIFLGGYVFGLYLMLINLMILYISSLVLDKVMFDISNSKVFYIYTKEDEKVKKIILEEFKTGFTIMPTVGGYSHSKGTLIMAVLPNRDYFSFKSRILEEDDKAFFIITECFESMNGYKKKNILIV